MRRGRWEGGKVVKLPARHEAKEVLPCWSYRRREECSLPNPVPPHVCLPSPLPPCPLPSPLSSFYYFNTQCKGKGRAMSSLRAGMAGNGMACKCVQAVMYACHGGTCSPWQCKANTIITCYGKRREMLFLRKNSAQKVIDEHIACFTHVCPPAPAPSPSRQR